MGLKPVPVDKGGSKDTVTISSLSWGDARNWMLGTESSMFTPVLSCGSKLNWEHATGTEPQKRHVTGKMLSSCASFPDTQGLHYVV